VLLALTARIREMEEMLRRLEWSGTEGADGEPGVCPLCWSVERVGHASDCELAALLAALPGAAEEGE
jgi:hypothetical protein